MKRIVLKKKKTFSDENTVKIEPLTRQSTDERKKTEVFTSNQTLYIISLKKKETTD